VSESNPKNKTMQDHNVGDNIEKNVGKWEFSSDVAKNFDDHINKSIPIYQEVQRLIPVISDYFLNYVDSQCIVYDIGCSTGETCWQLGNYHGESSNLLIVGIDRQVEMLKLAREKNNAQNVEFILSDISDFDFKNADLVISLFTLGFLSLQRRKAIIDDIYEDLKLGGGVIIVEKTLANASYYQDLYNQIYNQYKLSSGFDEAQVLAKQKSLRGQLLPLSISDYEKMFREKGFSKINCFLKWLPWTGWILKK
jgi:tRNA (cmo5U34)-methyltransferase